jgi:hypothetical protein
MIKIHNLHSYYGAIEAILASTAPFRKGKSRR